MHPVLLYTKFPDHPVLPVVEAVIRCENHNRVLKKPQVLYLRQQKSHPSVHQAHFARVKRPNVRQLFLGQIARVTVNRVDDFLAFVSLVVKLRVPSGRVPRLVRIERIYVEKEVIPPVVPLQPFGGRLHRARHEVVLLARPVRHVPKILPDHRSLPPQLLRLAWKLNVLRISPQPVVLLTPNPFPSVESPVEVISVLKYVRRVSYHHTRVPVLTQNLRQHDFVFRQPCPVGIRENRPPSQNIPPVRHRRERARKRPVEHNAPLRKSIQIRGPNPLVAIASKMIFS